MSSQTQQKQQATRLRACLKKILKKHILILLVFKGASCTRPYNMRLTEALHSLYAIFRFTNCIRRCRRNITVKAEKLKRHNAKYVSSRETCFVRVLCCIDCSVRLSVAVSWDPLTAKCILGKGFVVRVNCRGLRPFVSSLSTRHHFLMVYFIHH